MRRLMTFCAGALVVGVLPAMADIQAIGEPFLNPSLGGSWSQEWEVNNVGSFDQISIQLIAGPGGPLATPPLSFSLDSAWSLASSTATTGSAIGPPTDDLSFYTNTLGSGSDAVTIDLSVFSGGTQVDSVQATWTSPGDDSVMVLPLPEPASILLMGTLLLGVSGLLKRKLA